MIPAEIPQAGQTQFQSRIFSVERCSYTDPQGREHQRDIVRHPGSVVIVPLVDEHHVCLIRNFRLAVNDWLIELPAGTREPNEPAHTTALRELEEETGYRCESMEAVQQFFPAPGILDENMHLFIARGLQPGLPRREPGEEIENLLLTWDGALDQVRRGLIRDAKTIIGLLLGSQRRTG